MPTLTQDPIGLRQARSIRNRTEEISDELAELRAVEDGNHNYINLVQANIWNCISLANQWKSLAANIRAAMEHGLIDDYHALAEILRPAANSFVGLCIEVRDSACQISDDSSDPKLEGLAELGLAYKEAVSYQNWLNCWPSSTPESREAARKEIREGKSRPWREVADTTQGTK
jgi:quinol monooxygenase YgiN